MEPAVDTADVDMGEGGTRVSRRLSKRVMEKAPEGVVGGDVRPALLKYSFDF